MTHVHAGHRRPGSLAGLAALVWVVAVVWNACATVQDHRYLSLGHIYLSALTLRDVVRHALPLLFLLLIVVAATARLMRRPRALAALVVALPLAGLLAGVLPAVDDALRAAVRPRALRALVLLAVAVAPGVIGLAFARLSGRVAALRVGFTRLARIADATCARVRTRAPARIAGSPLAVPLAGAVVLAALLVPGIVAPDPPSGPPIVIVLVDTLRADHLGVYGYDRNTSRHIDAWARSAVVFERAIAQASWTKPSVASLFTGLHPSVHRTGSGRHLRRRVEAGVLTAVGAPAGAPRTTGTLAPAYLTFAEVFRDAGYETAAFVANGLLASSDGYAQGFERYEILDDRRLTREGVRYIREHAGAAFLLYLHYMAPHAPYDPPAAFDRFGSGPVPAGGGSRGRGERFDLFGTSTKDSINFTRTLMPSPAQIQELIDQYDGEIAFADELIESVFSALSEAGLDGRAVVVLTADHGEEFMDHGMVWHESVHLYEELTRVPLVIDAGAVGASDAGAGAVGGGGADAGSVRARSHQDDDASGGSASGARAPGRGRVPDPVMHIDLGPTLLGLAGVAVPAGMQGRSLVPLLEGRSQPPAGAYAETVDWGDRQATWRGTDKLIVDREHATLELYDLSEDPAERHDRSAIATETRAALLDSVNTRRDRDHGRRARLDVALDALTAEQLERLRSLGYVQ